MELNTQAIILRKLPYTGGSWIITAYTRERGAVSFMAKGIGRKGSGMSKAALQPLSRVELQATFRENRQLQQLRGLRPHQDAGFISDHPAKAAVAMFLAEVLYRCLREESPDHDLFDFIDESVAYFAAEQPHPDFHLLMLMHLTKYFGFFPSGTFSALSPVFLLEDGLFATPPAHRTQVLTGRDASLFHRLALTPFGEYITDEDQQKISRAERRMLLGFLIQYYGLHLEGMGKVKSLEVLMEVFG